MADFGERSAEEREAARLERERRRLGPAAGPPSPASPPAQAALPPAPVPESDGGGEDEWDFPSAQGRRPKAGRGAHLRGTRSPAQRARHRPHAPHSRAGRVLSLLALILAAAAIWFGVELFQPFHGSGHGRITVTIPPHSGVGAVGDLLARDGVISSSFFFSLRAGLDGDSGNLRAGTYHLKVGMSYGDVLSALTAPPPAARVTELTIIPGETRVHVSALLHEQHFKGSYLADTRRSALLDPARYGAPRNTPSLEGFLFPDTYQVLVPVNIKTLVADQLRRFTQVFATVNFAYARSKQLTPYDVLKIASLIQGEAATNHDLPLVASVIYNRLHLGMRLQLDSTTRYATGNFTRPLTVSELASPSPWNTHTHMGLPPTPINSPGLATIQAAAHPAQTKYLYFVSKPCRSGALAFANTYAQFLVEVQHYQSVRPVHGRYTAPC